ncbi:MAG TPA: alpha/beta fold hydrolase [Pyrinomonadaceae bacterium]|jgi:medium-chain acyl-[acyl-carrier-protein] hydrolase
MIEQKSSGAALSKWVTCYRPNPRARIRLFCFPFAGGGALTFRLWHDRLPSTVEVCAVQLPGHGNRLSEPPFDRLEPLVEALVPALIPYLDRPFVFFGHSMGALIAFELSRRLRSEFVIGPKQLLVSGRAAPQIPEAERRTYDLPEPEFIEELRRLNGTPAEVLEHPELLNLMIPILRADFAICQNYVCSPQAPFSFPLTAFGGLEDEDVSRQDLEAWREQTNAEFKVQMFPGDHFFLQTVQPLLLEVISRELERLAPLV